MWRGKGGPREYSRQKQHAQKSQVWKEYGTLVELKEVGLAFKEWHQMKLESS